jgi:hypothetical protein
VLRGESITQRRIVLEEVGSPRGRTSKGLAVSGETTPLLDPVKTLRRGVELDSKGSGSTPSARVERTATAVRQIRWGRPQGG